MTKIKCTDELGQRQKFTMKKLQDRAARHKKEIDRLNRINQALIVRLSLETGLTPERIREQFK